MRELTQWIARADRPSRTNRAGHWRRASLRLVLGLGLLLATPALTSAAPGNPSTPADSAEVALGGGAYEVTASVFGTSTDGLIGEMTASGQTLQAHDRLVALPACTVSSCPWLAPGTGPDAEWGPQESCAEEDGLCWVELISPETGACTVAPVLDVGPLFINDNWWAPFERRTYTLDQGVPAIQAALEGEDLGYGPGISDHGHDILNDHTSPVAIDLAEGTWNDLGLETNRGVAPMQVRMLWQAEVMHWDACGAADIEESTGVPTLDTAPEANATTTDDLNLRAEPGLDQEMLTIIPAGTRLVVTGAAEVGFYAVAHGDRLGWVSGEFLALDSPEATSTSDDASTAHTIDDLNLRAGPSAADEIMRVLPSGSEVVLTGEAEDGFVAVLHEGMTGWVYGSYLDTSGASANDADPTALALASDDGATTVSNEASTNVATVTSDVYLRAGPSTSDTILATVPTGAHLSLTGAESDGFRAVRFGEQEGWVFGGWLAIAEPAPATTIDAVNLRAGPSLADAVIEELAPGTSLTLTGETANGFAAVTIGDVTGWVFAGYLADEE